MTTGIWLQGVAAAGAAGAASLAGTRLALGYLRRRRILDRPNERSSHKIPTPRGGGLGVTPAVLLVWAALAAAGGAEARWAWPLIAGALVLMAASWADDRLDLPPGPRFLVQIGAVGGALWLVPPAALAFQGILPLWADRVIVALGWLWFVNLYNFMDGIDGITGIETTSLGLGIAVIAAMAGAAANAIPFALAAAGAALGFLVWNWHPARVFLGDVGSVPLGFLLGGLLLHLALAGQLAAAVILPAYYLADATITLGRRALRREKVWRAHRQHFYQRAVQGGRRHDQVALAVLAGNLLLIAAATAAAAGHTAGGAAAAVTVLALLLGLLGSWSRGRAA
ncbi:MAG: glycosyltransferase family 4 protein [Magnetospirillum sp.]|nr:glycosyltransferase family 4 protein [Magnetospirillum sp.]